MRQTTKVPRRRHELGTKHVAGSRRPAMEKEGRNHYRTRGHKATTSGGSALSAELLLNWGHRKRLRCVKLQPKDDVDVSVPQMPEAVVDEIATKTCRADRRSTRAQKESGNDVRQRIASPTSQRVLRNAEATATARANGGNRRAVTTSPERMTVGGGVAPLEEKKSGSGGSSSGSEGTVWPKFAMALTTKEKEEDFLVFKGSKLPQRPKKRAKVVQKTLNLVSPGAWLCDLTLERYEVREKKTSKKKPRGLKAMGNMGSDSE